VPPLDHVPRGLEKVRIVLVCPLCACEEGNLQRHNGETVIQVVPKKTILHPLPQIAMCRDNKPDIDLAYQLYAT
jgi:hypothetical protein